MNRANLAARLANVAGAPAKPLAGQPTLEAPQLPAVRPVTRARQDKTMIAGYFSQEMGRAVKVLAAERGVTVQALIGEGLDDVLRKYGKHPMGER